MSFENAEAETRARFLESQMLLQHLRSTAPPEMSPADDTTKALRGLWLVSVYAAVERSVNAITEAAIEVVSSHGAPSIDCKPTIHSIFHFDKVKSLNDCGKGRVSDASVNLFEVSHDSLALRLLDNPLAENLQNVDSKTMSWVLGLFGAPDMTPSKASVGRVDTLRERRNAVAHGRESAVQVGERYALGELSNIYNAADEVVSAFSLVLREHCTNRGYLKASA